MTADSRKPETSVARIDAVLALLESAEDRGSMLLAARLCEEIAQDAPAYVRDLALLRPGNAGLGMWMLLLSRVHLASAASFRAGDAGLHGRLVRSSVLFAGTSMKVLRARA